MPDADLDDFELMHDEFVKKSHEEEIYEGEDNVESHEKAEEDYRRTAQKKKQKLSSGFTTLAEMGTAPKSRAKIEEEEQYSNDENVDRHVSGGGSSHIHHSHQTKGFAPSRIPMQLFAMQSPGGSAAAFKSSSKLVKKQ
jgi:hypothetical protein